MFEEVGEAGRIESAAWEKKAPRSGGGVEELARRWGLQVDAKQAELLRSPARRVILNCCRQWGKSSLAAVKALQTAMEEPGATVLAMSPSRRQSGEFLRKVKECLAKRGGGKAGTDGVNELSVQLENKSRVVALPGVEATMRGFSAVDLLVVDEAARVADAQYYAAGPVLAVKNGALWLLSTPFGARGFFWKEWMEGGEEWFRVEARAEECARIAPEFLDSERRRLGAEWFRQEYECEFVGGEGQVFAEEWLRDAEIEDEAELRLW